MHGGGGGVWRATCGGEAREASRGVRQDAGPHEKAAAARAADTARAGDAGAVERHRERDRETARHTQLKGWYETLCLTVAGVSAAALGPQAQAYSLRLEVGLTLLTADLLTLVHHVSGHLG